MTTPQGLALLALPRLDAGTSTEIDAGMSADAGVSSDTDGGTTTGKPPQGCGCFSFDGLVPFSLLLTALHFRRQRSRLSFPS